MAGLQILRKSPACIAPASASAPATMLATTCPGRRWQRRAGRACPRRRRVEVGLAEGSHGEDCDDDESAPATSTWVAGMPSIGERMAMAAPSAAMRPVSHHDVGTNCHAGATSSGSASPLACKCIVASCSAGRRSLIADELIGEELIGRR